MNDIKTYIEKITNLSEACYVELELLAIKKKFLKNEILIPHGSRSNTEIFLNDGIVRAFFTDEQGNEKNTAFYQGMDFMSTTALRSKNGCSIYTYQAITDINILSFNSAVFFKIINKYPNLMKAAKYIKENEVARLQKRDECLMQVSAAEKYMKFTEVHPLLENKIPHYHIASYLGITPVTLSRIRAKKIDERI